MEQFLNRIICGDCLDVMREMPDESVDLIVTDPPYGLKFMGKNWDKAVPSVEIWKECLRVLKAGAFAFIMCSPRQDCLARMIVNLQDAGFETGFTSIYWTYASGFNKSLNISKAIDKRECRKRLTETLGRKPTKEELQEAWKVFREVIGKTSTHSASGHKPRKTQYTTDFNKGAKTEGLLDLTNPATPQAKALDGSYGGFQPKPALEIILVCMKPLSEKTFVDQALKNRKGITWLDDCRVPYESDGDKKEQADKNPHTVKADNAVYGDYSMCKKPWEQPQGRFPANLICSDDVLNDGRVRHKAGNKYESNNCAMSDGTIYSKGLGGYCKRNNMVNDSGSFSRYFSLDSWAQRTFPFLIVPKASKAEKNRGCEGLHEKAKPTLNEYQRPSEGRTASKSGSPQKNHHATVKPIKLMAYLVTLGSRDGDVVLDPFVGTGTTPIAAKELGRDYIGIDTEPEYVEIANCRLKAAAPFFDTEAPAAPKI